MIQLSWPPKELNPNARIHHMAKAKVTKAYREAAYWLAGNFARGNLACQGFPSRTAPLPLTITFHPPDRRRRDLDGMLSSIKAGLDGVADGLMVNDRLFELTLKRAESVKNGKVIIEIGGVDHPISRSNLFRETT